MTRAYLFLSLPRHDAEYTSTPWQLARELAGKHQVFFVDHPYTFWEAIRKIASAAIRRRWASYFTTGISKKDGVYVVAAPFVWPANFLPPGRCYRLVKRWNEKRLAARVNRASARFGVEQWLFVNSFNFYFHDMHQFLHVPVRLVVYHCIDPIIKPYSQKHGQYLEPDAAREADLVVSTAPALSQRFIAEGINPQSYLVPNAAQVELFATPPAAIHPTVQAITGKVMGYLGSIERRIDYTLLLDVLRLLPDWNLVLAGPVDWYYVPAEVRHHQRIFFTGPVPHTEAPAVIKRFDVALIPFLTDEASSGIYPLKLFEYLATGKPVVSTNFNPDILLPLTDVVSVTTGASEFAAGCAEQCRAQEPRHIEARQRVAACNTWAHRAQQWQELIEKHLTRDQYVHSHITHA